MIQDDFNLIVDAIPTKSRKALSTEIQRLTTFLTFAKIRGGTVKTYLVQNISTGVEQSLDIEDAANVLGIKPHSLRVQLSGLKKPLDRLVNGEHIRITP